MGSGNGSFDVKMQELIWWLGGMATIRRSDLNDTGITQKWYK